MNNPSNWDSIITTQLVIDLHAKGVEQHGGMHSPPKEGCLEQSLGNALTAEQYTLSDESIMGLCFAGYLLFYLAKNHCFTDGNKRIAWLAATRVLFNHGLIIDATDDEAEEFCLRIADGTHSMAIKDASDAVGWLAERIQFVTV